MMSPFIPESIQLHLLKGIDETFLPSLYFGTTMWEDDDGICFLICLKLTRSVVPYSIKDLIDHLINKGANWYELSLNISEGHTTANIYVRTPWDLGE